MRQAFCAAWRLVQPAPALVSHPRQRDRAVGPAPSGVGRGTQPQRHAGHQVPGRDRMRAGCIGSRPDRLQPAAQVETRNGDHGQQPGRHVLAHGEQAQHGRARPGPHRLAHRGGGAQPQRRPGQLGARAEAGGQGRVQPPPGSAGSLLPPPPAAWPRHGSAGHGPGIGGGAPRMVWADHHGQPVGGHHPGPQPARRGGPLDEAEVHAVLGHRAGHRLAVGRDEGDLGRLAAGLLVLVAQGDQPGGQQVLRDGEAGRNAQLGVPGPAQAGDAAVQLARLGQQRRRPVHQQRPGRGEPGPARIPVQQGRAVLGFHRPQPG